MQREVSSYLKNKPARFSAKHDPQRITDWFEIERPLLTAERVAMHNRLDMKEFFRHPLKEDIQSCIQKTQMYLLEEYGLKPKSFAFPQIFLVPSKSYQVLVSEISQDTDIDYHNSQGMYNSGGIIYLRETEKSEDILHAVCHEWIHVLTTMRYKIQNIQNVPTFVPLLLGVRNFSGKQTFSAFNEALTEITALEALRYQKQTINSIGYTSLVVFFEYLFTKIANEESTSVDEVRSKFISANLQSDFSTLRILKKYLDVRGIKTLCELTLQPTFDDLFKVFQNNELARIDFAKYLLSLQQGGTILGNVPINLNLNKKQQSMLTEVAMSRSRYHNFMKKIRRFFT